MNRRGFLRRASAAALSCFGSRQIYAHGAASNATPSISGVLSIDASSILAVIPQDFTGLSYESAQLANPAFFSAENTALITLFRELSERGVLRLGGGSSEFTVFTSDESSAPSPFDAVGPDTSKNVKSDTPITPKSLRNLRAFLDATGWRCLYGLNLGRGTRERAAEEARFAQATLGPRLIAFQLGNEPDAWRNRYRPSTWSYADYWKEWAAAHAAIVTLVPQARFAGPDVSNKMAYVTGFAQDVKGMADVVMLTSHYYAMGPAGAKNATRETLLSPDPKLGPDLATAMEAARNAGLPYRMSEGNSCWNGGQPGVSDTLASALWVVDMMLAFAQGGCAGVNLHGGGNGFYTPIAGSLAGGFAPRPEYWGMRLAQTLAGSTLVESTLTCSDNRVRAYAASRGAVLVLLAINKTDRAAAVETRFAGAKRSTSGLVQRVLCGPAIDANRGVRIIESDATAWRDAVLHVEPFSAIVIELQGGEDE
jgi:hypothetical protein